LVIVAILLFRSSSLPARGESASRLPALGTGRIRWAIAITAIVGTGIVIAALSANGQLAMTASLTTAIVCLSLTVVTGYAGQISLAQLGLAGAGAFFAAKFSASSGLTFWESLIVGVVVAAVFGLIVGLPALRTRGVSLAIVTLGLGLTVQDVILNNANLAGSGGELQTHQPTLFSYAFDSTDHPGRYAAFCLILFALCAIMVANVRRSRVGRQLIALRANERAAVALGINTTLAKLYAFVVAAGIAGLGGVLIAFEPSVIVFIPDSGGPMFDPVTAITLFSLLVVGGIGFIGGGLFAGMIAGGGLGAWLLSDIFHSTTADNWLPVLGGAAAVATVMFAPDGISARQAKDFARLFGRLFAYLDRHERKPKPAVLAPVVDLSTADSVLEINDLGVRFGGVVALDGVSVKVRSGEVVGLIGPNGAGKTTLMDAVSGLNRNYTGQILLNGDPIDGHSPTQRARLGIGRSFQQPELFDDLPVEDNLRVACEPPSRRDYVTGLLAPRRRELPPAAAIAVREFELADDLARMPGELPFGKRRLVGIARAVAAAPKILLLDEPAAGLDDHESEELATLITRLARERGYGILLIEHNVNLVMSVSDHVVALEFGRVIARGLPDEVRNDPALVSAYLGNASTVDQHEPASQV
jgi:sulfate-transporting ATPase